MFDTLIVSRPRAQRAWRRELAGPTFSLVAHSLVLYAAAVATDRIAVPPAAPVRDTTMILVRSRDDAGPEPRAPTVARVFHTLVAPAATPLSIPPIDTNDTFDAGSYSGVGVDLGPERGPSGPVDLTQVFIEAVVDEPPERIAFPPPEYPRMLLEARVQGTVMLEAVIDTLGHPEPGSVKVIFTTNAAFDGPARAAFSRALFRPGRVRGQRVRVLVHQPLKFSLP